MPRVGWLIFLVTVTWAGVYDRCTAMVDRDDDRVIGVPSTALLFGEMDRVAIGAMPDHAVGPGAGPGQGMGFGRAYWAGLAVAALLFAPGSSGWRERQRDA